MSSRVYERLKEGRGRSSKKGKGSKTAGENAGGKAAKVNVSQQMPMPSTIKALQSEPTSARSSSYPSAPTSLASILYPLSDPTQSDTKAKHRTDTSTKPRSSVKPWTSNEFPSR